MTLSQTSRNKLQPSFWQFDAIGTHWTIETPAPLSGQIRMAIADCIEQFDHIYSRFRDDSVVAQMTKAAGQFTLTAESGEMASLYRDLYVATDGAMTPLIGDSLTAAGYDKEYSFRPTSPLPAPIWDDVLNWEGAIVTTKQPLIFDIGAAGKGKLVDIVAQKMKVAGYSNFVIDASGDICHQGSGVQEIGLEDPNDVSRVIGMMPLSDASLCASAVNRRKWGNGWHHVIDARSGRPVNDVVATWVVAPTTMEADGLATALFFVDGERLRDITTFQFVKLFANGRIEHSRDFVGQLYT